ncbi:MAG: MFS transporter [Actinobacteria bacterium]|nr:MFS transporter [Actinomycetota bacterium]
MLQTDLSVQLSPPLPALVWPARRSLRLRATAAFWLQASIGLTFLAGSSVPTPLYGVYQARWGFSAITTTVVFGIYAIAVLSALLTLGSLSDRIGRRAVLLGATSAQAVVMLVFATATGVPSLIIARVLQGVATGSAMGAVGAAMLDIDPIRGPLANGLAPISGTAVGGLGAGFLIQYLPYPLHLSYLVLSVVFVAQAIGVYLMPETVIAPTARRGHRRKGVTAQSLRPRLAVPPAARRPLLLAAPMLVAAWAIAGFYGSLGPALVRLVTGSHSALLGGLGYSVVGASAVLAMLALRSASPRRFMLVGTISTLLGVGLTLVAVDSSSVLLLLLGTAGAGAGFGAGFHHGRLAGRPRRARRHRPPVRPDRDGPRRHLPGRSTPPPVRRGGVTRRRSSPPGHARLALRLMMRTPDGHARPPTSGLHSVTSLDDRSDRPHP